MKRDDVIERDLDNIIIDIAIVTFTDVITDIIESIFRNFLQRKKKRKRKYRFNWAGFKVLFVPHLSVRVRQRVGPSHGVRRRQTIIFVPPRPRPRFGVMIRLRGPVS